MVVFGQFLAIVAAITGAFSSIMYNRMGKKATSDVLAFFRMCIATPMMGLFCLFTDGTNVVGFGSEPFWLLFVSGVIGFFVTDLFMFRAYVSWGARETMVVMCFAPVLSAILAFVLFNETMTVLQIAGSALSIIGILIMVLGDHQGAKAALTAGAVYAFIAAILQAVADMTAKSALSIVPWRTASFVRAIGGLAAWFVFVFANFRSFSVDAKAMKTKGLFLTLFFTVIIGTALGTTVAMGALNYAPAGIVTSLKQISPIFILPFEVIVEKKKLTPAAIIGTFVSVVGVFIIF